MSADVPHVPARAVLGTRSMRGRLCVGGHSSVGGGALARLTGLAATAVSRRQRRLHIDWTAVGRCAITDRWESLAPPPRIASNQQAAAASHELVIRAMPAAGRRACCLKRSASADTTRRPPFWLASCGDDGGGCYGSVVPGGIL